MRQAPPRLIRWQLRCSGVANTPSLAALLTPARLFTIPPIQLLSRGYTPAGSGRAAGTPPSERPLAQRSAAASPGEGSPRPSNSYVNAKGTEPSNTFRASATGSGTTPSQQEQTAAKAVDPDAPFSFAMRDSDRGVLDHGVSPAALDFIARAEAEYRASSDHLHSIPGGPGMPEVVAETVDEVPGAVRRTVRVAAPVGETYVPSSKAHTAVRGTTGELEYQRSVEKKFLLDERSQLNLRKERQLNELLESPMPLLGKAEEAVLMLAESFYPQSLALQPRTAETVMLIMGQASLQLRLQGRTREEEAIAGVLGGGGGNHSSVCGTSPLLLSGALALPSVPFLSEMRQLYARQKAAFAAPTPLTVEHLMTSLSAVTEPSQATFQLANRVLLDCDKYVVLPTRTTYAAYFAVCRANSAVVPFAVARMKDAVQELNISLDAPMATELLRGLSEGGYIEEAVALLARLGRVPMTTPLLNASLETLLLSRQPTACFAVYESVRRAALKPNADTFTLLLLSCEQSGQWGRVTAVLAEMQRRRVKGDAQTLNLLLKGLLTEALTTYAAQLHRTMTAKGIEVWPALEDGVRRATRKSKISGSSSSGNVPSPMVGSGKGFGKRPAADRRRQ